MQSTLLGIWRLRALPAAVRLVIGMSLTVVAVSAYAAEPLPLTLEHAWSRAERSNPAYQAVLAQLRAAEGQVQDTRAPLWNNPQLNTEIGRRRLPDGSGTDWSAGVSQTFEIAGQRKHRADAARLELSSLEQRLRDTHLQLRAEVERRFVNVLALQTRVTTEAEAARFIEEAAMAVEKRRKAGEDTKLEANLARVEADRARNQLALLQEQLIQAAADLAAFIQLPPGEIPTVQGELDAVRGYTLDQLLESARQRPLLSALATAEEAARARLNLERASVYPDVTLGVGLAREGIASAQDRITWLTVNVPLPLFKRNAAGIGRAVSDLTQVQVERSAAKRDIEAQVRTLWQQLESLRQRAAILNSSTLPRLAENQRLSTISYRSGAIGLLELLLANRQLVEGRRDAVEAAAALRLAQIDLEAATGVLAGAGTTATQPRKIK